MTCASNYAPSARVSPQHNEVFQRIIMNNRFYRTKIALVWLLVVLCLMPDSARAVDPTFDLIQTKTGVYSNVTVTTQNKDYIVIQHARGLTSIKVSELPHELNQALGYGPVKGTQPGSSVITARARSLVAAIPSANIEAAWSKHAPAGSPTLKLNTKFIIAALGVFAALYLFFCYCGSLICQKAGKPAGILMWLPIVQYIPLLRAAKMSPLWLLAMFVPLLNIIVHIMWSFKIAGVRGQGIFTAIFLILPTYPLAFMYLAFASGSSSNENLPPRKVALSGMTFDQA
jgi:hypothetical protein